MKDWISTKDKLPNAKPKQFTRVNLISGSVVYLGGYWSDNGSFYIDGTVFDNKSTSIVSVTHYIEIPDIPEEVR